MSAINQWLISQYAAKGGKVYTFDRGSSSAVAVWKVEREKKRLSKMNRYGSRKLKVAIRRTARNQGRFITRKLVLVTMADLHT